MNVLLSHELEAFVRAKVESGEYGSSAQVIEEALMLLDDRDHVMVARKDRLLRLLADGVAQALNHQLIDAAEVYRGLANRSDLHAE
ncbi:MAG: type II toxin-antitoxin system ParD family antitoxin [Caldimonas sp.]